MGKLFDPILKGIGWFLSWMDSWSGNYLFVLLIFTILVELLLIPFGIKQQKNSIKQASLRPKEMAIRKKYAGRNDKVTQQKVATEIQELYQKEGYNQLGGCLPLLIQLPIILAIYKVVTHPLEYVVKLKDTTIAALTNTETAIGQQVTELLGKNNAGTIKLVSIIREKGLEFFAQSDLNADALADLSAKFDKLPDFTIFGINLGYTPSLNEFGWLLIIPVLTFVVYFASMKLTKKFTYQPTMAQDQAAGCSNQIMDYMMPLFSLFITFSVPAAVGIYWIFKSIFGTLKQFILHKMMPLPVFTDEDYKEAEKELKGKAPEKEREMPAEPVRSLCDDDDDEPYPTFVGVRGGRYDDDGPDDKSAKEENAEEKKSENAISNKLDAAPLKDDSDK